MGNLRVAFWLNTGFALLELVGGFYTNSVAIMSDALHDFGDSLSLGLAHYFEKKSTRSRDEDFSYGYKRFSLLGSFVNSIVLIIGSVFIIQEAISRLFAPEPVDATGMLILAAIGIVINLLALLRLRRGKSLNEKVVSLHFLEDVLGWVAVLIGATIMQYFEAPLVDPILSILIAAFILFNVFRNLKQAFHIILQGIPDNVDMDYIKKKILSIPGILNVHDLHTWTLDGRYNVMTIHIVLDANVSMEQTDKLKHEVRHQLEHLNIQHVTVETELENNPCILRDC